MLTQQKVRDVKLILDKCPSLQELYLVKVMDASHGCSKLIWPHGLSEREFCLTMRSDNPSSIADWQLELTGNRESVRIWSASTNDVLQIYKLVLFHRENDRLSF
jgi:hypothetical protein